jgi:hypothetical protein
MALKIPLLEFRRIYLKLSSNVDAAKRPLVSRWRRDVLVQFVLYSTTLMSASQRRPIG